MLAIILIFATINLSSCSSEISEIQAIDAVQINLERVLNGRLTLEQANENILRIYDELSSISEFGNEFARRGVLFTIETASMILTGEFENTLLLHENIEIFIDGLDDIRNLIID